VTPRLKPSALVRALSEQLAEAQAENARLREALEAACLGLSRISTADLRDYGMYRTKAQVVGYATLCAAAATAALRQTEET
jgi:hypothetical protein